MRLYIRGQNGCHTKGTYHITHFCVLNYPQFLLHSVTNLTHVHNTQCDVQSLSANNHVCKSKQSAAQTINKQVKFRSCSFIQRWLIPWPLAELLFSSICKHLLCLHWALWRNNSFYPIIHVHIYVMPFSETDFTTVRAAHFTAESSIPTINFTLSQTAGGHVFSNNIMI